jgi:adenine C2-methylase RlmN of 23S rRNA A2503 and tRNA A37
MQILRDSQDPSVNFVEQQLTGFIESRYVRRAEDYFIAYLSSQTGCNRGCRMCHLTATGQTQFKNCDLTDFVNQFETVLRHYEREAPAKLVHINWMARGEPMANPTITETSTEMLYMLGSIARDRGLATKFNISTILPVTLKKNLVECFPFISPTIYYSIYSVDANFRKRWLPTSLPVDTSLELLKDYQSVSKKIIKFHGAFIKGENDHVDQVREMAHEIWRRGIRGEFNIVRYNPLTSDQGLESVNLEAIQEVISEYMPCKIISRVGREVYASCGQFISGNQS